MSAIRRLANLPVGTSRSFSCSAPVASGHSRWSKIKHDKAKVDVGWISLILVTLADHSQATVNKQRNSLAQEIQFASKEHGPDVQSNSRLATAVAAAKKQGFPKQSIENAIKRGQGISPSGLSLQSVTLEAMIPPSVAVIMECQTDGKARLLQDVKTWAKNAGGTITPVSHFFDRTGKIVLENTKALTEEDILDPAVDAGANHIYIDDDGNIVVHTNPEQTMAAAKTLSDEMQMKTLLSDIVWKPKEELMVDVEDPEKLQYFISHVEDDPSVQQVYVNVK